MEVLAPTGGSLRMSFWRVDRVALTIVALLAGIGAISPSQFTESVSFMLSGVVHIAPYLLASVAIAAALKAASAEQLIARVFEGRPLQVIISASLFGALSPFCSCGVIPLIAALLSAGVPLAPVMAFWISSPVIAPDMFVLTAAELGLHFALGKTAAAIGVGLLAGGTTWIAQRSGLFADPLRGEVTSCGGSAVRNPQAIRWRFWSERERRATFAKSFAETALFLGKWLTLAFLLESLMVAYLPAEKVAALLGDTGTWAIPLSVVAGVPAYLNGYAAIPLVSGLMATGMSPGAAMAFMTAGAMTSIPAALAVFVLVRSPVFTLYLALALVGSVLSGALYQVVAAF